MAAGFTARAGLLAITGRGAAAARFRGFTAGAGFGVGSGSCVTTGAGTGAAITGVAAGTGAGAGTGTGAGGGGSWRATTGGGVTDATAISLLREDTTTTIARKTAPIAASNHLTFGVSFGRRSTLRIGTASDARANFGGGGGICRVRPASNALGSRSMFDARAMNISSDRSAVLLQFWWFMG
jgi:hypothetical protein